MENKICQSCGMPIVSSGQLGTEKDGSTNNDYCKYCYENGEFKEKTLPNPNVVHPIPGYDKEIYIKPTIKNPNIIVGDFTYIADSEFESHVTHHYDFNGDKLIIGKFLLVTMFGSGKM